MPRGEHEVPFAAVAGATDITEQMQTKGPEEGFAFPLVVDLVDASAIDPDELLVATIACGGPEDSACKTGYRCATGNATSACVPM